jgi:hypothetical protein
MLQKELIREAMNNQLVLTPTRVLKSQYYEMQTRAGAIRQQRKL